MTKEQAIECVTRALPYPQHIKNWEFSGPDTVYFTWRRDRFKLYLGSVSVGEIESIFEKGSNLAIAVEQLIKRQWIAMQIEDTP